MHRWSSGQIFFWHGPQNTLTATFRSLAKLISVHRGKVGPKIVTTGASNAAAMCRGPILLVSAGATGKRMTGHPLIRPRLEMRDCTFVETRGDAVRDGNVVTVSGRPYQHLWVRGLLDMLRERPDRQRSN